MRLCLIVLVVFFQTTIHAIETGVLNVFTDLPTALIKVDGLVVAQESIVKLPLQVGEHYVQVEMGGELVYAEEIVIVSNRSTTVVSEHFVDIITKTPSRGAIDREAERLRKSRGDFAFGFFTSNKLQSQLISMKWWAFKHVGFHTLIGGTTQVKTERGLVGGRVFVSPADKIYEDQVLSGALFIGFGQKTSGEKITLPNNSVSEEWLISSQPYSEFGFNIEAYVGQLVKDFMKARYNTGFGSSRTTTVTTKRDKKGRRVRKETTEEDYGDVIRDLVIVILTQIGHVSGEMSLVKFPNQPAETNVSAGIHFYF